MSISQLTAQHFTIVGKKMKLNVPGCVLVYFKLSGCPNCKAFDNVFIQCVDTRLKYAMITLDGQNRTLVSDSLKTETPLQSVPMLIFYANGVPYTKFAGQKNAVSVQSFVSTTLNSLESQQQGNHFVQAQPQQMLYTQPQARNQRFAIQQINDDTGGMLPPPDGIIPKNTPWKSDT